MLIYGLGAVGNAAGIITAIKRKSGFWGGLGLFIVGGMLMGGVGYVIASVIPDSDKANEQ